MSNDGELRGPTRILTGVFVALALALAVFRYLDADELEHLHATWLVLQGQVPFRDFFEHHHPLTWFVLAPLLSVTGESASAILVFRLVFFLLTLAIARVTYLIALECAPSRAVARLAVVLLLSMTTFVGVAIEIRPDVPQVLFSMLSVLYAVRWVRTRARTDALLCGAAAGLAFLFLQKAVFVLAPYPFAFAWYLRRRLGSWSAAAWFSAAFVGVLMPAWFYLTMADALGDYVISNWLINAHVGASGHRVTMLAPEVLRDVGRNAMFWMLAGVAFVASLRRATARAYAVPFWLGMSVLGIILLSNRVADRYLAATIPLLAIGVAGWCLDASAAARARPHQRWIALALVLVVPTAATCRNLLRTNTEQLAQIRFVLANTTPADHVYDVDRNINVFRPDCHYYWFRVGPAPRLYQEYSGARRQVPDVCRTLADVKPAFVSRRRGELEQCGLMADYRPTPVRDLFVRRDHPLR